MYESWKASVVGSVGSVVLLKFTSHQCRTYWVMQYWVASVSNSSSCKPTYTNEWLSVCIRNIAPPPLRHSSRFWHYYNCLHLQLIHTTPRVAAIDFGGYTQCYTSIHAWYYEIIFLRANIIADVNFPFLNWGRLYMCMYVCVLVVVSFLNLHR